MKQLRSRFRFLSLLLTCAFLLTAVLCAGKALREANITLPSLPLPVVSLSPEASASPESVSVDASESSPDENHAPGVTPEADQEYNVFGL